MVSAISDGAMRFDQSEMKLFERPTQFTPGATQFIVVTVESITTGAVTFVVGGSESDPISSSGTHELTLVAGQTKKTGVIGDHTDAVVKNLLIIERPGS